VGGDPALAAAEGCAQPEVKVGKGSALANLSASLDIESAPQRGTIARVSVPLASAAS